ncbi:glycosyl transferase [Aerococcus sanguinicola]|uniref:Glycosyl transferase n=1 Tax=Aerococcus sanguinicola TaxID=119206 RepID=A0A2I1MTP1_9LACT|nr:glycosyltransferase [Aerococcus sanguinicola]PKZ23491.1 glycosyl transferase [Aerococcus sanguinicola]
MKVLQINSVIDFGSTGRICRDLYDFLEENGHECVIAYGRGKSTPGYKTIKIGSKIDQALHGVYSRLFDRHGFASRQATRQLIEEIEEFDPDIIHLHNIHGYYLNIEILFNYLSTKDTPVVWLLHDQWSISGHSANFNLNDDGTLPTSLKNRDELKNYPKTVGFGQFKKNLRDKEKLFTSIKNMTNVTPSHWLESIVSKSFLNKYPIMTIYNGVNTDIFKIDFNKSNYLRKQWNSEQKIVILGVASIWDPRKGLDDFIKLSQLLSPADYQIVLVGSDPQIKNKLPRDIVTIERTNSVEELKDIYNASDVFVNPTYFDNFPTVNIEALACGTPVITYDTGGSGESINENTGTIVDQGNFDMLLNAIEKWGGKVPAVKKNCRRRVLEKFNKEKNYKQYLNLYKERLNLN